MAEKRGNETLSPLRGAPSSDPSLSDPHLARIRIRQRWEFASVLNFLHVFKPLIEGNLKISAEQIETSLITPNDDLMNLHVALLKGIPPVNKNMTDVDTWVTVVCKKLTPWWPWVAEGENPLKVDHGKEIQIYKALDPITRVVILKALCEVRAQQDDVLRYITDELKKGTDVTIFRKERIGGVGNGVSYWYDEDPDFGHRLYKEVVQVEFKQMPNGKDLATQPTNDYQWEILATKLDEFQKISVNLSSSEVFGEVAVGEVIKTKIIPVLEGLQKRKERALKRKQKRAFQSNGYLNSNRVGYSRSCRERRPVRYTFDEYDRSIDEAIEITNKLKITRSKKDDAEQAGRIPHQKVAMKVDQGNLDVDEINETRDHDSNNDDDEDYETIKYQDDDDECNKNAGKEDDDDDDFVNDAKTSVAVGLYRSQRLRYPTKGLPEMKKRLRQRPTHNSAAQIALDSEGSSQEEKQTEMVSDSEVEDSGASHGSRIITRESY